MPLAVACPKCKTRYSLPDQLMGKPVKCKSCSTLFQVNAPQKAVAQQTSPQQAMASAAKTSPTVNSAELARLGLDGPILRQPDLFGEIPHPRAGNPLGNHVVVDPGFAEIDFEAPEEKDPNDISAMFRNPALETIKPKKAIDPKAAKKRKRKKKRQETLENAWVIVLALYLIGLAAMIIMWSTTEIQTTTKAYVYVINPALGLVSIVVSIWWLVRCFETRNSVGEFFLILIPFYIFVYSLKEEKIERCRALLYAWLAMAGVGILMVVVAYFLGITEQMQYMTSA